MKNAYCYFWHKLLFGKPTLLKFLSLFFCVIIQNTLFSQEKELPMKQAPEKVNHVKSDRDIMYDLKAELEGTYQFILKDNSKALLYSKELFEKIKFSREYAQPVYLDLEEGIKLYIPSKIAIEAPNYEKLEPIVYLTKSN